jgi:ribosomal protein S18 acetylase RimI-like enzyme
MEPTQLEIVPFKDQYLSDFVALNVDWLEKYFEIEDYDLKILNGAKKHIIDPGGEIFFARIDNKVVGTVAMINREESGYELSKMAVAPEYQGLKIGQKLMDACMDFARRNKIRRVYLESNTKLIPAINLYRKNGFREFESEKDSPYVRSNIKMEIWL